MNADKSYAGWIVFACVAIVAGFGFFALINQEPDQNESDCSNAEVFDASKKRCKVMTGLEYAKKWAATDEKNADYGKKHATVCTPAEEVTSANLGEYRLVCFSVEHIYSNGKGTVYLNSKGTRGDFSAVSFRNTLSYADAQYYLGKHIGIYGNISSYNGELQVIVDSKNSITTSPHDYYEGYSKEELQNKRSSCFESKITGAKTKEAKNAVNRDCRILTLKNLIPEDEYEYDY